MKIAITGASGFLGTHITQKLKEKKIKNLMVFPVDIVGDNISSYDILSNTEFLKGMDVVIHLAGPTLFFARKYPYEATQLEVLGTLNILESMRKFEVQKIIYASSYYVYDGMNPKSKVNENTKINFCQQELFGKLKIMSEGLIMQYNLKFEIEYVIFRIGSVYGPGRCSNIIKTFFEAGVKNEPIEIWGKGKRQNQYIYSGDVADAILKCIELGKTNKVYNLTSPERLSIKELANIISKKYGFKTIFNETQPEGRSLPYVSPKRIQKELGMSFTPLNIGIDLTFQKLKQEMSAGIQ